MTTITQAIEKWKEEFIEDALLAEETHPAIGYALNRFAENILMAVKASMPDIKRAHTYASENADIYHAHDKGQEDYRSTILADLSRAIESIKV